MNDGNYSRQVIALGRWGATALTFAAALMLAIGAAWVSSTGDFKLIAICVAALFGVAIAFFPLGLITIFIAVGMIISGASRLYLPEIQQIRWSLIPVSWLLLAHCIHNPLSVKPKGPARPVPAIIWWALGFIGVAIIATLVNIRELALMLAGLKGYFQLWGVLLAFAFITWPKYFVNNLPKIFFWIAVLQLPFVLHQYIVIVPTRVGLGEGIVPVDIVAGTFGANEFGGGANAVLSTYLISIIAAATALWRQEIISSGRLLIITIVLFWPILINEAKISIVYMAVAFIVLFRSDFVHRPARFFAVSAVAGLVFGILLLGLTLHAPEERVSNLSDLITYTYEANFANDETFDGSLTRWASFEYWYDRHKDGNYVDILIGHGAGFARLTGEENLRAFGFDQIDPELDVGRVAAVSVLWDFGVIGLIVILGLFACAFTSAERMMSYYKGDGWKVGVLHGAQATLAVLLVNFFYKNYFSFHIGFQSIFVLVVGYITYWVYQSQSSGIDIDDRKTTLH